MKMNVLKYIIIIIITYCLFACNNSINKELEIKTLKESIQLELKECTDYTNNYKVKLQGGQSALPYAQLTERLNVLISKKIDTTFKIEGYNQKQFTNTIQTLNSQYQNIFDSISKTSKYKLFLKEDEEFIANTQFEIIAPYEDNAIMNQFLTFQKILHKHKQILKLIEFGTSSCYMFFTRVENSGFMVNVTNDNNNFKIKLFYRYPKRYAIYELLDLEKIINEKNLPIKILTKTKTINDTLVITANNLRELSYKALLKYRLIKSNGDIDTVNIEMPFSIR